MVLPDVVGNITQNYTGRFLQKVEEESETHSQRDLMMGLGNIAEDLELHSVPDSQRLGRGSRSTTATTAEATPMHVHSGANLTPRKGIHQCTCYLL